MATGGTRSINIKRLLRTFLDHRKPLCSWVRMWTALSVDNCLVDSDGILRFRCHYGALVTTAPSSGARRWP